MKYTITNAILLDGTKDMKPVPNTSIWIDNDKIVKVFQGNETMPGSKVIDAKNGYVMPGLINMHIHMAGAGKQPKPSSKPKDYKKLFDTLGKHKLVLDVITKMQDKFAYDELASGVTTVRAVGGIKDLDGKTRDRINSGKIVGPRIISCNTAISVPGGHFAGSLATEAVTVQDAVRDVQEIAKTNPDWIKLMITGGVMDATEEGEPGALRMNPDLVKAACDEAHKLGLKVCAHVESSEGVRVALENGVDTVEHGAVADEKIIELFKKRGAADICTISPALPYSLFDLEVSHCGEIGKKNGDIVFKGVIQCAKECLKNGIPVGMGTDTGCPFITHYNMWREVHYFKKYMEVSPEFALYTATLKNAEIAGIDKETGSIEAGKCADIIISEKNPLEDFRNLQHLKYVFAKGKMIANPKYRVVKGVDAELDKWM